MQATVAGRCGIVTDATSSIGRAVALELARDGARVALGYRGYRGADFEAVERLVGEVTRVGGEAVPLRLPVDSLWELEQVLSCLVELWGRLDFVVDLDGQCAVGRAALPWMVEGGRGRIVHIRAAAVANHITRSDLRALATRGVAINTIRVDRAMPRARVAAGAERAATASVATDARATPQDIAATTQFLLAQACCLTGQVIDLRDGSSGPSGQTPPRRPWRATCRHRLSLRPHRGSSRPTP